MSKLRAYRFSFILLGSIIIGSIVGFFMGEKAELLKPLGDIFLNLMFMVVVPLVFFSLTSTVAQMSNVKRLGKIMGSMMLVFLFTGLVAAIVMTIGVKIFPPSEGINLSLVKPEAAEEISIGDQLVKTITVSDFVELFSRSNMLALILFSVLIGFSAALVGDKAKPFVNVLQAGSEVMMKVVGIIMWYAPIGLGTYFAYLIGVFGPELAGDYIKAVLLYYPLSVVYFIVFFTLFAFMAGKGAGVKLFWKNVLSPTVTSLATCSSAATIPTNLEASKGMGVSNDVRETVIPMGAIIHKDGSVLGGILKIAFLFGVFGMDFSGFGTITTAVLVAILVGTVMGAIPSGGMIGEMLILSLYGFPPEALPIIAAISTIIDPPATMLNATGDNAAAMLVNRLVEGKDWTKKASTEMIQEKGVSNF